MSITSVILISILEFLFFLTLIPFKDNYNKHVSFSKWFSCHRDKNQSVKVTRSQTDFSQTLRRSNYKRMLFTKSIAREKKLLSNCVRLTENMLHRCTMVLSYCANCKFDESLSDKFEFLLVVIIHISSCWNNQIGSDSLFFSM